MIDLRASRRYAKALFELAKEKELDRLDSDLLKITDLVRKHPEISHLVENSTIATAEKEDFIDKIFGDEAETLLVHFLKVLIHKKRFREIFEIQEVFHRLAEQKKGIRHVTLLSPFEVTPRFENRLKSALEKKWSVQVRIESEQKTDLLGGIVLRFEGKELDLSYRRRLEELKQRLLS